MTINLENQIALVTGASRGIGRAIADCYAAHGALVIGTATSEQGAAAISDRLATAAQPGKGWVLDVSDPEQVTTCLKAIAEAVGAPTIVVNNAGITADNLFLRMKTDEWQRVIDTDLSSVFHVCKAAMRAMIKARSGRIINISSVIADTGNAGQCNYAAAKAGLIGFSKSLAQEVASRQITVNVIAPGFIETDMTGALTAEQKAKIGEAIPMARMGSCEDIAHAALYLASPWADYVTGQTLHVNGGMYMK